MHKGFVANFHGLKIYLDMTRIGHLKTTQNTVYEFLSGTLIPAVANHLADTFKVAEKQETMMEVATCGSIKATPLLKQKRGVDLIIIVTAETDENSDVVASSAACQLHPVTKRPTVGVVNFNPKQIDTTKYSYATLFGSSLHEFIHVMGFNNALFPYFTYKASYLLQGIENVYYVNKKVKNPYTIITKGAVEFGKTHFKCDSIIGLPIADPAKKEVVGSHWHKETFGNEMMVATGLENPVLSGFTLHFMADSGWYNVNFDMQEPFFWGLNQGCDIIEGKCGLEGKACKDAGETSCFYDFTT